MLMLKSTIGHTLPLLHFGWAISANNNFFFFFFLFLPEKKALTFHALKGDNLHEKLIFSGKKYFKISSAVIFSQHAKQCVRQLYSKVCMSCEIDNRIFWTVKILTYGPNKEQSGLGLNSLLLSKSVQIFWLIYTA